MSAGEVSAQEAVIRSAGERGAPGTQFVQHGRQPQVKSSVPGEQGTASQERAQEVCRAVAAGLQQAGQILFVTGSLLGPDRAAGRSRWRYGSDGMVGLALAVEIG